MLQGIFSVDFVTYERALFKTNINSGEICCFCSLKNLKILEWRELGELLRRTECRALDLRKMIFVKDRDTTWAEIIGEIRSLFLIPLRSKVSSTVEVP